MTVFEIEGLTILVNRKHETYVNLHLQIRNPEDPQTMCLAECMEIKINYYSIMFLKTQKRINIFCVNICKISFYQQCVQIYYGKNLFVRKTCMLFVK